jgi:O-antigen/teichoic acid export membrane protein
VLVGGPGLLAIVFGGDYAASFKPLFILVSGLLVGSIFGFPGLILISSGFDRDVAKITFFTTFAGIVASYILIGKIGLPGACYSFASGLVVRKYLLWRTLISRTALNSAIYATVRPTPR